MIRVRSSVLLLAVMLTPGISESEPADEVVVTFVNGRYQIRLERTINAPINEVYRVLTDYEHLSELNPHIKESRLLNRTENMVEVFTRIRGCVLFFCRTIDRTHAIVEESPTRIDAELVADGGDVVSDRFSWLLTIDGQRTRVLYDQEIEPAFWIPPFVGPAVLKRKLGRAADKALSNLERLATVSEVPTGE